MKKIKSPCIDICNFTGPKKWCIGCARTIQECESWKSMKTSEKKNLINKLKKRMKQIKNKK